MSVSVSLSICLHSYLGKTTTCLNFTKLPVHVACGRGSVHTWSYLMYFRFYEWRCDAMAAASLQCCERANTYWLRLILDNSGTIEHRSRVKRCTIALQQRFYFTVVELIIMLSFCFLRNSFHNSFLICGNWCMDTHRRLLLLRCQWSVSLWYAI